MDNHTIEALGHITFPYPRPRHNKKNSGAVFSDLLPAAENTEGDALPEIHFDIPFMSLEGILILAEAHEEEFSIMAQRGLALTPYSAAADPPDAHPQYAFDFYSLHSGEEVNEEI